MTQLTSGTILKGFLKGGATMPIATSGQGLIKYVGNTGNPQYIYFQSINVAGTTLGEFYEDVDVEFYVKDGTLDYTASTGDFIVESLSVISGDSAQDPNVVKVTKDQSNKVTGIVGADGGAILELDSNGNINAQVNHRTNTLANLLSLAGGNGELSVATDAKADISGFSSF